MKQPDLELFFYYFFIKHKQTIRKILVISFIFISFLSIFKFNIQLWLFFNSLNGSIIKQLIQPT
ncbi:hypothetical protein SPPR111872_23920 [Sphingobacterium prati]